jgi:hypothetical protein
VAQTLRDTPSFTAWLSATHVIGFTLVMSGGVVWNLRAAGALLNGEPIESMTRSALRVLLAGLAISLITGIGLFTPRAIGTAATGAFQLKIALLAAAAALQLALSSMVIQRSTLALQWLRIGGALGFTLWLSLALTACWFILFE